MFDDRFGWLVAAGLICLFALLYAWAMGDEPELPSGSLEL